MIDVRRMQPRSISTDILIIGAGPAGAAAACALVSWGHRVVLVDRPGGDSGRLAESIPPSARKLLTILGLAEAVDRAGFVPWRGNTVWWAGSGPRVESFAAGEAGYQVIRRDFDRCLRDAASAAGAVVLTGAIREVHVDPEVRAAVDVHGAAVDVTARFVLDASGRAGVLARRGWRVADPSHHTVALAGVWQSAGGWPGVDNTHTLVASYADGWAWSVPVAPSIRHITVMVDPERTGLARGASSRDVYLGELEKVTPLGALVSGAELVEGPWGADASLYSARQYAGSGWLLLGDAGTAIDPLSSFGVKKALASAWLGAVAVHTALINPAMSADAFAFFDRRERTMYTAARRQAADYAASAAADTAHAYWLVRAGVSNGAAEDEGEPDAALLRRDPAVLAAFDDLKRRASIRLRLDDDARIAPAAAVRGHEIIHDDHLFGPAIPDGLRFLRGVDLVHLVREAGRHDDAGALYAACAAARPAMTLPDFFGALSWLVAIGVLRHG